MAPNRATLLALSALLAAGCGAEDPAASPARRGDVSRAGAGGVEATAGLPRVVFLGDSITAGLHLSPDDAFPALLEERLAGDGLPFTAVNAGVSGDTAAGGRRRVDWILRQDPDVVVVELGGNDGLRGGSLRSVEEDLRAIVERVQASGARVLLLGMRIPPSYGFDYASDFAELYERVAEETDAAFVPYFMDGVGGVARYNLADGLHPNEEGHARLAENVEDALAEVLREL